MDVRTDRLVATYQPGEWPAGVLTGYDDGAGGFALEHMVAFDRKPQTLLNMLREALDEAWARDFQYITFYLPKAFPLARQLALLGMHLGFEEYSQDERHEYFVCHRPPDAAQGSGRRADAVSAGPPHVERAPRPLLHDAERDAGG